MAIDKTRPVFLKKMVIDPLTGNVYPPLPGRAYLPGGLPERFLTEEFCTQDEGALPTSTPDPVVDMVLRGPGDRDEQTILPSVKPPGPPLPVASPQVGHFEPEPVATAAKKTEEGVSKVKINEAIAQVISDELEHVGPKAAEKVVSDREANGPYKSVEDLDKRVPLGFGRKWEVLAEKLEF